MLVLISGCPQILQVKEKIQADKGWEASTQKLIYSGLSFIKLPHFDLPVADDPSRQDITRCQHGGVLQHRGERLYCVYDI